MQSDEEPASARTSDASLASYEPDAPAVALAATETTIEGLRRQVVALRAENTRLARLLEAAGSARPRARGGGLEPFELTVLARPHAPAAARAALSEWLGDSVPDDLLEDARLLLTELVTNCLQHGHLSADAPIRIRAHCTDGRLRLEVSDPGQHGIVTPRAPDLTTGGGYGLHLVEMLAARWGVNRAGGTHVWLELTRARA
jgi:anti-sigma regulatory factor (Ser/Thr protein kinase)